MISQMGQWAAARHNVDEALGDAANHRSKRPRLWQAAVNDPPLCRNWVVELFNTAQRASAFVSVLAYFGYQEKQARQTHATVLWIPSLRVPFITGA